MTNRPPGVVGVLFFVWLNVGALFPNEGDPPTGMLD